MDVLHAPWRIDYVLGPKRVPAPGGDSLFTEIGRSTEDEANYVIARGRQCFVVLNAYPYNAGHLMVVPYRQVPSVEELTDEESLELMQWTQRCVRALQATLHPSGFNVGLNLGKCAGAGIVEHLHLHIVPRWEGDTNFMPVLGSTSVVPEALRETAAKLRSELSRVFSAASATP